VIFELELTFNRVGEKMSHKAVHEPEAKVMDAAEVWEDAQQIANLLLQNLLKAESLIQLQIPLSIFLSALENLTRDELMLLLKRVQERLAA